MQGRYRYVRRRKDSQLQARILERLGFIAYATGDIDAASDIADEALTLLDRTNQPGVTRTRTIVTAAKIAVSRGQLESALQLVREALAMTHRAGLLRYAEILATTSEVLAALGESELAAIIDGFLSTVGVATKIAAAEHQGMPQWKRGASMDRDEVVRLALGTAAV